MNTTQNDNTDRNVPAGGNASSLRPGSAVIALIASMGSVVTFVHSSGCASRVTPATPATLQAIRAAVAEMDAAKREVIFSPKQ